LLCRFTSKKYKDKVEGGGEAAAKQKMQINI